LKSFISPDIFSSIATEQEASDLNTLKSFLLAQKHPVVTRWQEKKESSEGSRPVLSGQDIPLVTHGIRVILKNARIYADRVIIEPLQKERKV
jgi:CO dehydrogenase/acetyl-CoA synthase beta subunit